MHKSKILYVNHRAEKCGVYEFGRMVGAVLERSTAFDIVYSECNGWKEFRKKYEAECPDVVIYNFHPRTMPWICGRFGYKVPPTYGLSAIQIGTIHEVYQAAADSATDLVFDYHIAPDPTLILRNPFVYKTGRLVRRFNLEHTRNEPAMIGSFGFGTNGKGFDRIVERVQKEFDQATININISFARYGDANGHAAKRIAEDLLGKIVKPGVCLNVTHHHFTEEELVCFLAKNDLNVFLYDYQENRGIASTAEWAMSARRPLAISKSSMFRHLFPCYPSICVEDRSLAAILKSGTVPTERLYAEWSPEVLLWDYERILSDVIRRTAGTPSVPASTKRFRYLRHLLHLAEKKAKSRSVWFSTRKPCGFTGFSDQQYTPVELGRNVFNRILDDNARALYAQPIQFLQSLVPDVIRNKIAEANVQQAFVFDTAYRLMKKRSNACRMLAVGAFEDSAYLALQKLGFPIDGIDPNINYDLATFITRPDVHAASYDLIISTSVIEHVPDDERFIRDIAYLLKPGGTAILTCDFHNSYTKGFDIPAVDYRFYTQCDILERLMKAVPDCSLYGGGPQWDCAEYDFWYAKRRYNYTFATIVFSKAEAVSP
jgi:SAM-dependent methyltransferase